MANSIYRINKCINKSIEFKGLRAQYIWYLGGGIMALLIIFAALYIIGVNQYICLCVILFAGSGLIYLIYSLSRKYGEHGMMKTFARKSIPDLVKCNSRKAFRCFKNKK